MFRLEMLPARCGDCLLLEYGPPGSSRVVVIDGGLGETATVLWKRLDLLRHQRGVETLEIELLVVTHIDNDHIVGIIELLKADHPALKIHDIWFNGRPPLRGLPAAGSPAIGGGDPALAPAEDLLGRTRSATPELGAYEYRIALTGSAEGTAIRLAWTPPNEPAATSLTLTYAAPGGEHAEIGDRTSDRGKRRLGGCDHH